MSISIKSCFGWPQDILMATVNTDLGLVSRKQARRRAKSEAMKMNSIVYLRDPTTDKILDSFIPATGRWFSDARS